MRLLDQPDQEDQPDQWNLVHLDCLSALLQQVDLDRQDLPLDQQNLLVLVTQLRQHHLPAHLVPCFLVHLVFQNLQLDLGHRDLL